MLYFQIAWDLNKMKINVKKNMLVNICLLEKNDFFAKVSLFPLDWLLQLSPFVSRNIFCKCAELLIRFCRVNY